MPDIRCCTITDYNNEIWNWGNIGGYLCLRSVLLFGISAVLVQKYLIPDMMRAVVKLGERKCLILSAVISVIYAADILICYFLRPLLYIK